MYHEHIKNIEIDGEVFEIERRKRDGQYIAGYYLFGHNTGELISEKTIERVETELRKASNKQKIYARKYWESAKPLKRERLSWKNFVR